MCSGRMSARGWIAFPNTKVSRFFLFHSLRLPLPDISHRKREGKNIFTPLSSLKPKTLMLQETATLSFDTWPATGGVLSLPAISGISKKSWSPRYMPRTAAPAGSASTVRLRSSPGEFCKQACSRCALPVRAPTLHGCGNRSVVGRFQSFSATPIFCLGARPYGTRLLSCVPRRMEDIVALPDHLETLAGDTGAVKTQTACLAAIVDAVWAGLFYL